MIEQISSNSIDVNSTVVGFVSTVSGPMYETERLELWLDCTDG